MSSSLVPCRVLLESGGDEKCQALGYCDLGYLDGFIKPLTAPSAKALNKSYCTCIAGAE